MAQAFVTTYQNCYRYTAQPRTPLISPEKAYKVCYGKDEDWYKAATIDKTDIGDYQKIEQAVKNLNIKRMSSSTYRVDYCRDWKPKGIVEDSDKPKEETEFQLLDTFKPTYRKNKDKIKLVPPVQTTRNIFGYLIKSQMYKPYSTFQHYHGSLGFDLLEKAHQERNKAAKDEKKTETKTN